MFRKILFTAAVASCAAISCRAADDVLLAQLYGSGVHAFNSRDYIDAFNQLTSAIKGGTIDPRAFYFRGLTYLQLGREPEAIADFKRGAELETTDSLDVFPVSTSLARVQGSAREMLEQYRQGARVTAAERAETARQARYQERQAAEQIVLRHAGAADLVPTPPGPSTKSSAADSLGAKPSTTPGAMPAAGAEPDPFAEPKAVPAANPATPKPDEAPKQNDPFTRRPPHLKEAQCQVPRQRLRPQARPPHRRHLPPPTMPIHLAVRRPPLLNLVRLPQRLPQRLRQRRVVRRQQRLLLPMPIHLPVRLLRPQSQTPRPRPMPRRQRRRPIHLPPAPRRC